VSEQRCLRERFSTFNSGCQVGLEVLLGFRAKVASELPLPRNPVKQFATNEFPSGFLALGTRVAEPGGAFGCGHLCVKAAVSNAHFGITRDGFERLMNALGCSLAKRDGELALSGTCGLHA
jgi:hypothetical protein